MSFFNNLFPKNNITNSSLNLIEPFSLSYPKNDLSYTNILLIDKDVNDYQIFYNSVNYKTFPIVYSSYRSTKTEILNLIKSKFTGFCINRIAFCFESSSENTKLFLDNDPFFTSNDLLNGVTTYSSNVEFIISLIHEFKIKNIDFIACNTLNYPNWVNYYNILSNKTNVIIGASNDKTGNIKYGGDWTMENTKQNIEFIYFTKSIEFYKYLLDTSPTKIYSEYNLCVSGFVIDKSNNYMYCENNDINNNNIISKINTIDEGSITNPYFSQIVTNEQLNGFVIDNLNNCLYSAFNNIVYKTNLNDGITAFWFDYNPHIIRKMTIDSSSIYMYISCISCDNPGIISKIRIFDSSLIDLEWITGLISPDVMCIDNSNNYMYVSNFSNNSNSNGNISQIDISNALVNKLQWFYDSSVNEISSICIDDSNNYMYIGNFTIANNSYQVSQINMIDGSLNKLYWCYNIAISASTYYLTIYNNYMYLNSNQVIRKIDMSNGNINKLLYPNVLNYPFRFVIDNSNNYIYTNNTLNNGLSMLGKSKLDGTIINSSWNNISTIPNSSPYIDISCNFIYYSTTNGSKTFINKTNLHTDVSEKWCYDDLQSYFLVVDKTNTYMYSSSPNSGLISKINMIDGSLNTLNWCTITSLGMVIDNSNTYMYAVNFENNSVTQIDLSANVIKNLTFFTSSTFPPFFLTLDVSNTYMYVNLYDNTIIQIDMTNTSIKAIINTGANPERFPNCGGVSILGNLLYNVISYDNNNNNVIQTFPLEPIPYVPIDSRFSHCSELLTEKGNILIKNLKIGDSIKTLDSGNKKIYMIGKRDFNHYCLDKRIESQLYKCTNKNYPELTKDLIVIGETYIKNNELPAYRDTKTSVYEKPGNYTLYYIALEDDDVDKKYYIWVNGLLIQSCSIRYLQENLEIIDINQNSLSLNCDNSN